MSERKRSRWPFVLLGALALGGVLAWRFAPALMARVIAAGQARNDAIVREELAFHVGTLAYVYGYPLVDMAQQMHNETHPTANDQQVYAPVNRIFSYGALVTPSTQGNLRMPNHDTLYFSGWYDVSQEPVLLHVPDTAGRYYTIAVTNFYSEVEHIGRRTTGTAERMFALVPPGYAGSLPEGVTPVATETPRGWLLGRMLVNGAEDAPAALALIDGIWTVPLSEYVPGQKPALGPAVNAAPMDAHAGLAYFDVLNAALREVPPRASDAALIAQLDAVGIGPAHDLDLAKLDADTKRGLERAFEAGKRLVDASMQASRPSVNGWITPRLVGRYGHDFLARATVVKGGYGNLPEESLYAAILTDQGGALLTGGKRYRLRFEKGATPPVGAFWSLIVYDIATAKLVENEIARYSIGDRTPGLVFGDDGSLTIALQPERPAAAHENWLPTPRSPRPLIAVVRMYEPKADALSGEYVLPEVVRGE
ncbi:MAG: DUF1254 domain-containing protein [Deltaproteobacteria bacterium]|nr:DUF1254 domain-containing protein [Deltaproteobacteria bacterium]